jgi:hypothetical protein
MGRPEAERGLDGCGPEKNSSPAGWGRDSEGAAARAPALPQRDSGPGRALGLPSSRIRQPRDLQWLTL